MRKGELRIRELENQLSAQAGLIVKLMLKIEQLEKELSIYTEGFPYAVLVHDCWKPYFRVKAGG
ncbi:MAG: hypothetical protein LBJ01_01210 [Tannerella sp.]|jgi:hypothetical protein|nr:hypothetical protein [Tannerella sp.]